MINELYEYFLSSSGISTDTREIEQGKLFFALKGEKFNANQFARQAIEKGASKVVIDDPRYSIDGKTFLVEDTLTALQDLARYHRDQLDIPVIGLTGSNGKTTSKELIHAVLSKKYKTFATKGNLNNHIGVPLSILSIDQSKDEIAVIEMGANHVGEIAFLCTISKPSHGFITNIGKAHIGEFGGFENIIRGKSELYDYLIKSNGTIFVNSRQEILLNMTKRMKNPVIYPGKDDYFFCDLISADPFVLYKSENGERIQTQLIGSYNFDNIATALCIGKYFEVDASLANEAVASFIPANNRSQIIKKADVTIILDAYNANPSSMEAALKNLRETPAEKKAVILGDMKELGLDTEKEHAYIGKQLDEYHFDLALLIGEEMKHALKAYPNAKHFNNIDELIQFLKGVTFEKYHMLIKGSRSMKLEKTIDYI